MRPCCFRCRKLLCVIFNPRFVRPMCNFARISSKPEETADQDFVKLDRKSYNNYCNYLIESNSRNFSKSGGSLSAWSLMLMPESALCFNDGRYFVRTLLTVWWREAEKKLDDLPGYRYAHPLFALSKLNKTEGGVVDTFRKFRVNPVEKLAVLALNDVENTWFTITTFTMILQALTLTYGKTRLPPTLDFTVWNAFLAFFDPNTFSKRRYASTYHRQIGQLLHFLHCLDFKPPRKERLKVIVDCCAQNLTLDWVDSIEPTYCFSLDSHFWNLYKILRMFLFWKVDVDEYFDSFWVSFFRLLKENYAKLGEETQNWETELELKCALLRTSLLIVLKFDKEQQFEEIKKFWQTQTKLILQQCYKERDIFEVLLRAKARGKLPLLSNLVSENIYQYFINGNK